MKQVKGGVTAAKGFEAASTAAGIKYKNRYGTGIQPGSMRGSRNIYNKCRKSGTGKMGSAGRKEWCKSTGGSCELRNRQCLHRSRGIWIL